MELLSPAGNPEKLYYAYRYGADAAYIGLKNFSLRVKADNFSNDEYISAASLKGDKKLYAALNIFFHNTDIRLLEENVDYISGYPIDAFIISDPGILPVIKKYFPEAGLHLSTQANCVNTEAAKFYRDAGFSRIIPGRELSLKEIEEIKNNVSDLEIEVFVHGAMCLAYSGRCFLSRYMAGRSANKGDCSHSCRWKYSLSSPSESMPGREGVFLLEEEERPGEYFPAVEGNNFTSILSSKDLCMIDHIGDLRNAGVDSLKIEGRMKSLYYAAVVTRAYRKMIDYAEGLTGNYETDVKPYRDEVFKVSHREFSTGFYFGREEIETPTFKSYQRQYLFLGTITEKLSSDSADKYIYRLDVKNQISRSCEVEYIGPDLLYLKDSSFSLFDSEMSMIDKTDHGKTAFLRTDKQLEPGFIIRRKLSAS